MKIILYSVPVFFLLIGLELLVQRLKGTKLYSFGDSLTNIGTGMIQQGTGLLFKVLAVMLYAFLYEEFRFFSAPETWWSYTILFIGVDFCYYWFHRASHEVSVLWGTHIVHHQSEEYNLSVALRQSAIQVFGSTWFFLPLALLGFPTEAFLVISTWQTLYQFWIHTKTIKFMPAWFEYIFNTPSHHRVHHGQNPKYIDKNHGGTLIIFDRMFGTFQLEEEEVVYGVTKPLNSFNPIWANLEYYGWLGRELKNAGGFVNMLKMLVMPPGWRPASAGGPLKPNDQISTENQVKYAPQVSTAANYYALFLFIQAMVMSTILMDRGGVMQLEWGNWLPWVWPVQANLLMLWTLANMGGTLEQKSWVKISELLRYVALLAFVLKTVSM